MTAARPLGHVNDALGGQSGGWKINGFGSMGSINAVGSEVENVKHVQPAGGIAGFNPDSGIPRPECILPSQNSSTDSRTQVLTQVLKCRYLP